MKKAWPWLKQLSITKKVLLGVGTLIVLGAAGGNHQTNLNATQASSNISEASQTQSNNTHVSRAPAITTKTETETQAVPFQSTTVQDPNLAQGTTKVTTAGVNGSETLTYQLTFTDNKQTDKKLIDITVDVQPVSQVTSVGTYVAPPAPTPIPTPAATCPNGTYVNSAGNTVCSPYSSPSAPAGATAQCVDGTYSFSQSRSGTCSHHGGVATWL